MWVSGLDIQSYKKNVCYFRLKLAHFGIASMLKQIPSLLGHCHLIFFFPNTEKRKKENKSREEKLPFHMYNIAYKI